ncbi:copper homeostasis membrane protein CopD [Sphingomonas koreensis]
MIAWAAGEGTPVALRFLVYLDLLLLAGLSLCARRTVPEDVPGRLIAGLAVAGTVLTVAQLLATALAMTGGDVAVLDAEMLRFITAETPTGLSGVARFSALTMLAIAAVSAPKARALHLLLALAALAALAWTGHAGASEGGTGMVHRASDILHLIAASAWLGTLALLLRALARSTTATADLVAALRRFAFTGTLIVGTLIISGIVNLWAIAGLESLPELAIAPYGRSLGLKLALFAAMLGFAAFNRWYLVPRLKSASQSATRSLRTSVALEAALAVGVIGIVAMLGTLTPGT